MILRIISTLLQTAVFWNVLEKPAELSTLVLAIYVDTILLLMVVILIVVMVSLLRTDVGAM